MPWSRRAWNEPLTHFIAVGLALYLLYSVFSPGEAPGDNVIVVNRDALLTHLQYRSKAFEPSMAEAQLDAMSPEDLERLKAEYVREEALHREALAMGMDADDYIIKRRLIQKVEFLAQGVAESSPELTAEEIEAYFRQNQGDYRVEPFVTFTHVFFDAEKRGAKRARAEAGRKLGELNARGVPFSEAPGHGDRFLYHVNYVERTPDYVASHFGQAMAEAILTEKPSRGWIGPFESAYGFHLVLLAKNEPGRTPELEEVRARVEEDARRAAARAKTEEAIDKIVDSYEVRE